MGLALLAACGGGSATAPYGGGGGGGAGGGGGGGHTTTITVSDNTFAPTPDTVSAGQITFSWSGGVHTHNVTWDSGPGTLPANSADQSSGTYPATLQAGTYQYHCTFHGGAGTGMHGTVVVH